MWVGKSNSGTKNGKIDVECSILILLIIIFIIILFRTAWLGDDAFITFRTIDHFVNGRGLVYNPGERVQSYTHPLWMFLLSLFYLVTREFYFTTLIVSVLLSTTAIFIFAFKIACTRRNAILGITALIFSRAFIDYSTSGLENPLTHFLLALFCWLFLKKEPKDKNTLMLISLCAGLLITNRMDMILLIIPALGYACFRSLRSKSLTWFTCLKTIAIGFMPFILWELFSLFYYGFPFPNTAYAKIKTGIEMKILIEQGFYYLLHAIHFDPLTLIMIIWSMVLVFGVREKNKRSIALAIGIILYLFYILRIGGDFMSGRLLASLLFISIIIFPPLSGKLKFQGLATLGIIIFIGFISKQPPILTGENYGANLTREEMISPQGVADERAYYYQTTGLLKAHRDPNVLEAIRDHIWKIQPSFRRKGNIYIPGGCGFFGLFAGPKAHVIDRFALVDPLLARLPVEGKWRIGHFSRSLPDGYIDTLDSGENKIKDKDLALFYNKLSLITKGPLLAPERLKTIWLMNWGCYDALVDMYSNRHTVISPLELSKPKPEGTPWDAAGNIIMGERGVWVLYKTFLQPDYIEASVESQNVYRITYFHGNQEIASQNFRKKGVASPPHDATQSALQGIPKKRKRSQNVLLIYRQKVPEGVKKKQGFNKIHIFPVYGNGNYSIGHLKFNRKSLRINSEK